MDDRCKWRRYCGIYCISSRIVSYLVATMGYGNSWILRQTALCSRPVRSYQGSLFYLWRHEDLAFDRISDIRTFSQTSANFQLVSIRHRRVKEPVPTFDCMSHYVNCHWRRQLWQEIPDVELSEKKPPRYFTSYHPRSQPQVRKCHSVAELDEFLFLIVSRCHFDDDSV